MSIAGIGVDVVDLKRFEHALVRTPALKERLFAESERELPLRSLAGRFAAKEALIKSLGDSTGVQWHDMVIVNNDLGNPSFVLSGGTAEIVAKLGITDIHVSMSHDAGVAIAQVVTERRVTPARGAHRPRMRCARTSRRCGRWSRPRSAMAVVKADAYGHGAIEVARAAVDAGADWLGVADLDEALALRAAGIDAPMLAWLHGAATDFALAADAERRPRRQHARPARARPRPPARPCTSSSNTGLSRNGFEPAEAPAAFAARRSSSGVRGARHLLAPVEHLAGRRRRAAGAVRATCSRRRRCRARRPSCGTSPRPRPRSPAPSCASTWCAPGIGIYGLPAADGIDARALGPASRDDARGHGRRRAPRPGRRRGELRLHASHRASDDAGARAARLRGRRARAPPPAAPRC